MIEPNSEVIIKPQYNVTAGIDIHKDSIVTHVADRTGNFSESKTWDTYTKTLKQISVYFKDQGVESVLMESTGVYWISLYHILTDQKIEVVVSNPAHIKQIPKRKTDKKDAKWLCTLMMNGLVRKSFIPQSTQFEFRELCRTRDKYNKDETRATNRIVKILERANIKIRTVASSIRTKTCQSIIEALIQGEIDPDRLSELAKGKLKQKKEELKQAVEGYLTKADIIQLKMIGEDVQHFRNQRERIEDQIKGLQKMHYGDNIELLDMISGIGEQSAQSILSEIGTDMTRFEDGDHLASWAGLAPGNNESAGKRKNTSTKKGNKHLRTTMIAIAWAAKRTKKSYWSFVFAYYKSKMPAKKAITVVARKMLKLVYNTLLEKRKYVEGGEQLYLLTQQRKRAMLDKKHAAA